MSNDKITGVFVRLPLSDAQITAADRIAKEITENNTENEWRFARHHFSACDSLALALGMPVTGGDLYPVGYITEDAIGGLATGIYQSASIFRDAGKEFHDTVALVRLESAQATIAALEAEVGRLREALSSISDNKTSDCPDTERPYSERLAWAAEHCRRTARKALKGPEA